MIENTRYNATMEPSPWILRFGRQLKKCATALDLACGGGRNGRWFLLRDIRVTFLDRNISGLTDLTDVEQAEIIEADLETSGPYPLGTRQFECVVVTNYLRRDILANIFDSVAPSGILIYETFGAGNQAFGRPRNPDFLLQPNELLNATRNRFHVLAYEHGLRRVPSPAVVQRIAAVRM